MTTVLSPSGIELPDGTDPHSRAQVNRNFTKVNTLWNMTTGIGAATKGRATSASVGTASTLANQQNGTSVLYVQSGNLVGATDASGYIVIGFPENFPNFACAPVVSSGDVSVNAKAKMDIAIAPFTPDLTKFYVKVTDSTTGAAIPSTTFRFNWVCMGG